MTKPECPTHIGQALQCQYKPEWLEALFKCFDKMHNTGTLSRPFLQTRLKKDTLILNPRLSFEVRTTDMDFFFELKIRFCADGSKMILGKHYDESYSPSCSSFSFRFTINIIVWFRMLVFFIDASNAFQTNVITNPSKRHYLGLPSLYLQWFASK